MSLLLEAIYFNTDGNLCVEVLVAEKKEVLTIPRSMLPKIIRFLTEGVPELGPVPDADSGPRITCGEVRDQLLAETDRAKFLELVDKLFLFGPWGFIFTSKDDHGDRSMRAGETVKFLADLRGILWAVCHTHPGTHLQTPELLDHLEAAWGVIANANGGDWKGESEVWQGAAERWRDRWDEILSKLPGAKEPLVPLPMRYAEDPPE